MRRKRELLQELFGTIATRVLTHLLWRQYLSQKADGSPSSVGPEIVGSCRSTHGGVSGTASNSCDGQRRYVPESQPLNTGVTKENSESGSQTVSGSATIMAAINAREEAELMHDGSGLFTGECGACVGLFLDPSDKNFPSSVKIGHTVRRIVSVFVTETSCQACEFEGVRPIICTERDAYWECSECNSTHWIPLLIN